MSCGTWRSGRPAWTRRRPPATRSCNASPPSRPPRRRRRRWGPLRALNPHFVQAPGQIRDSQLERPVRIRVLMRSALCEALVSPSTEPAHAADCSWSLILNAILQATLVPFADLTSFNRACYSWLELISCLVGLQAESAVLNGCRTPFVANFVLRRGRSRSAGLTRPSSSATSRSTRPRRDAEDERRAAAAAAARDAFRPAAQPSPQPYSGVETASQTASRI